MKKKLKWIMLACCIITGFFLHPLNADAAENNLKDVGQVVLVTVSSSTSTEGTATAYEKSSEGKWITKKTGSARVGKKGIEPIATRKQGDNKTPQGIMKLLKAYGKKADPGALFKYTRITSDMYWDLNSGSSTYNRLVYKNPGGDYEHLIDYNTYNYMFTTDYNYDQTAGKGGAIFFHCNGKGATSGCISVPESTMKWYMTWLDPDKNPVIIVTTDKQVQKYFVPATKITSIQAESATSLKISWKRVYGTARYYIQRSDSSDGTYKTIKTITNPKTTSWVDEDVKSGKNYYYRIKTRNYVDGETGYTGTSSAASNKIYLVKYDANGGSGKMKNTWIPYGYSTKIRANSFTRSGYTFVGWKMYRKSDKKWYTNEAGWQTANSISKNEYTKYVKKDKTSLAKSSSVNKDTITLYAVWAKNPSAPELISAGTVDDSTIRIEWKASSTSSVKGYRIYRKTEDSKWKRIAQQKGRTTTEYNDTTAEKGVNYIYTVRAYRISNDVTVLSSYDKNGVSAAIEPEKGP